MSLEKRKARRVKKEGKVKISIISNDKSKRGKAISYHLSKDISILGVKILSNTFLPVDSMLKIEVSLTKPPRFITGMGRVRWVKSRYADELFEMGIEFVNTPKNQINALKKHLEEMEE